MFKKFLEIFDKLPEDSITDRIFKQEVVHKHVKVYALTFIFLIVAIVFDLFVVFYKRDPLPAVVFSVVRNASGVQPNTVKPIPVTLPIAHQSFQNVTNWLTDALVEIYSFDFLNYNRRVQEADKYFTDNGYTKYLNALEVSNIKTSVIDKKLIITTVPLNNPILVNSGNIDGVDFWRFKVPVLINFTGGDKPLSTKSIIDVYVQQVPAYVSHKGIAITGFSIENL